MSTSVTTYSMVSNLSNNTSTNSVAQEQNTDLLEAKAPRIAFFVAFISFGFLGNLFLTITILRSRGIRSVSFFAFVLNLAVANNLECLLNISILLAKSISNEWTFGEHTCRVNAFFMNFINIEIILGLAIASIDRFIAVCFKDKYDHVVSCSMIGIMIAVTWIQSFAFSAPLATGSVPTSLDTYMIYCTISKGSSMIYNCFALLLCFLAPIIIMIICFIKIICTIYKDRFVIRSLLSQKNYNDDNCMEPLIKQEIRHTYMALTIFVAWFVLQGPYLVMSYFKQFQHTSEIEKITKKDISYALFADLALLIAHLSYVTVLPLAAFLWRKDLWKSLKDKILCRKNNSVFDESFKKNERDIICLERKIKEEKLKEKEAMMLSRELRVFQVPVLFATSHGVHIQTFSNEIGKGETDINTINGGLRGRKCDVIASQDNLNSIAGETTSDYDSGNELDPFSASHPVSVWHTQKDNILDQKRSLSETEIGDASQTVNKHCDQTVGSTSEGDSGLDISTSHLTNTSRIITPIPLKISLTSDLIQNEKCDKVVNIYLIDRTTNDSAGTPIQSSKNAKIDSVIHADENYEMPDKETNCVSMKTETCLNKIPNGCVQSESTLPKRKKKRRKQKSHDTQSISSFSSAKGVPPRPPSRLAPINSISVKALYSGFERPDSRCSSQFSMLDNNTESIISHKILADESKTDINYSDVSSLDNLSISSFSMRKNNKNVKHERLSNSYSSNLVNYIEPLTLECNRDITSVPKEVVRPSNCYLIGNDRNQYGFQKLKNEGVCGSESKSSEPFFVEFRCCKDECQTVPCAHMQSRNMEARKKRREKQSALEKFASNALLNPENKGYKLLVPETP